MAKLGKGYYLTHPGEVIKDEIEARGISQRALAGSMGISYSVLNEILNARRPLTTKTALMFEVALNLPADALMRLQLKYNLHEVQNDRAFLSRLKKIKYCAAVI